MRKHSKNLQKYNKTEERNLKINMNPVMKLIRKFKNEAKTSTSLVSTYKKYIKLFNKIDYTEIGKKSVLDSAAFTKWKLDPEKLTKEVSELVHINATLIKSIPAQYLNEVQDEILEKMGYVIPKTSTKTIKTSRKEIEDIGDVEIIKQPSPKIDTIDTKSLVSILVDRYIVTESRATLIARDQASKINATLEMSDAQRDGLRYYVWKTSEDNRVRETHKKNNDKYIDSLNPPLMTGNVGRDVNCRCTMEWVEDETTIHKLKSGILKVRR